MLLLLHAACNSCSHMHARLHRGAKSLITSNIYADANKEEHKQGLISVWEDKELEQGALRTALSSYCHRAACCAFQILLLFEQCFINYLGPQQLRRVGINPVQ